MTAPGLAARSAAAALLAGVLERKTSLSDQVAPDAGPLAALAPGERARARALATTTLRHLGRIDAFLAQFLARTPRNAARNALRLAVAEMRLDGVPAHAAVDGAVRAVRSDPRARHLAGLVNAVARRAAEAAPARWEAVPDAPMPEWLAAPVRAACGADAADAIHALHLADTPPIDLTLRDAIEADRWAECLGARVLPTGSLRLDRRVQISALAGYAEGAWWVQDAAAALPARLFGDVRGVRTLDVCAAPGGKTLQLAAAGAMVTALDVSAPRLARLAENLSRTGLSAEIVAADARAFRPEARYDAVLLDAPCSATGTLRRHPDLPFLRDGHALEPLQALQSDLLDTAWRMVAPGGSMVYCTCSLLPAEGEDQVARFRARAPQALQSRPDARALGVPECWIDAAGGLRTRPDQWAEQGGMDGFYGALLRKPSGEA